MSFSINKANATSVYAPDINTNHSKKVTVTLPDYLKNKITVTLPDNLKNKLIVTLPHVPKGKVIVTLPKNLPPRAIKKLVDKEILTTNPDVNIKKQTEPVAFIPEKFGSSPLNPSKMVQITTDKLMQYHGVLSGPKIPSYKNFCEKLQDHEFKSNCKKALSGSTPVYFPTEYPDIVVKESKKECQSRMAQMIKVTEFININKIRSLTVPKVIHYNHYLIEERLPVSDRHHHNIHTYITNLELFNLVAKEMVLFYKYFYLTDLLVDTKKMMKQKLCLRSQINQLIKWDNIPLYISIENGNKTAKVGLIDLDNIEYEPNSREGLNCLVRMFPCHYEIIVNEAKALKLKFNDGELRDARHQGLLHIREFYLDHAKFIKEKKVSGFTDSWQFFNTDKFNQLEPLIEEELLKINNGINPAFLRNEIDELAPKNLFNNLSDEKCRKETTKEVVKNALTAITTALKKEIVEYKEWFNPNELSEPEKLEVRSVFINKNIIILEMVKFLKKYMYENIRFGYEQQIALVADQIFYVIFKKLLEMGEIFSFDQASSPHNINDMIMIRY